MGSLIIKRRNFRKPQVGDMRTRIQIIERDIRAPAFGSAKATHDETIIATVWSSLHTLKGKVVFSNVEIQGEIAYLFQIRYQAVLATLLEEKMSKSFVTYGGNNYKIQKLDNMENRNWFYNIFCTLLGDSTLETNK